MRRGLPSRLLLGQLQGIIGPHARALQAAQVAALVPLIYDNRSVCEAHQTAVAVRHRYSTAHSAETLSGLAVEEQLPESKPVEEVADGPLAVYQSWLAAGTLRADPRQLLTARRLQKVYGDVCAYVGLTPGEPSSPRGRGLTLVHAAETAPVRRGWFSGLFGPDSTHDTQPARPPPVGLYMYGGVGVGKTMLMDLFASVSPPEFQLHRIHFHDFMIDVHTRLRHHSRTSDPLKLVADEICGQTKVLCLDELFVTDIADASILNRLFQRLWENGIVLVATSNRKPDALYEGGLQRDLFLPFIAALKDRCLDHDMESTTDYRKLATHSTGLYFVTTSREDDLYRRFVEMATGEPVRPATVQVAMGRELLLPKTAGPLVYATFSELCGRPLGAADYIALASAKHTLFLSGVPKFTGATKTEAYRFVTLIDVLYEHRTRFLCAAEVLPVELFEDIVTVREAREQKGRKSAVNPNQIVDDNLGFAKDRTISRLMEMQSDEYLEAHAKAQAPELLVALQERKKQQA